MEIAREAEHRYDAKVSWGLSVGQGDDQHSELWTHVAAPVMTRLRQPQRMVLDTLVDAGVARSRADALAWCVDWSASTRTTGSPSSARRWRPWPTSARRVLRPDGCGEDRRRVGRRW